MIVVSTVVWCPENQEERSEVIIRHLESLEESLDKKPSLFLIIDNSVEHPKVRAKIEEISKKTCTLHKRFEPQLGWAKGRNYAMEYFMDFAPDSFSRLVITDCDQIFKEDDWLLKIDDLSHSHPELHSYMIRPDKYSIEKEITLDQNLKTDVYSEWLGATNVFSKEALNLVGGYDYKTFPLEWGFHDCHYGRRLLFSGILNSCHNLYIDPIRTDVEHGDSREYNLFGASLRNKAIHEYMNVFFQEEKSLSKGKSFFFPYRNEI